VAYALLREWACRPVAAVTVGSHCDRGAPAGLTRANGNDCSAVRCCAGT
jgi:hypothetical protein